MINLRPRHLGDLRAPGLSDQTIVAGCLQSALVYAAMGWQVFPVYGVSDGHCACGSVDCGSAGKHPLVAHGLHNATTDSATIKSWFERYPNANVAIRTGAESRIVVVDIDPRHRGNETLAELERDHGPVPVTAAVRTGGGGRHLFFRQPGGIVRSRGNALGPGIDVRGEGGYVVAVPSIHISGDRYEWKVHPDDPPLAAVPAWMLARLTESVSPIHSRDAH